MSRRGARTKRRAQHQRARSIAAGVLTLLVIAAISYHAFDPALPFSSQFTLAAISNNAVSLRPGSPVRVAGVDEGTVQRVTPDGGRTQITFSLNATALPVHSDATVTIRDRLFLEGGYYLQLNPGSPTAPTLRSGATIPTARTTSPVQLYKVLSVFTAGTRLSLARTLDTLSVAVGPSSGETLAQSGAGNLKAAIPHLVPVLRDVAWIAQGLQGSTSHDIPVLLNSGAQVSGAVAARTDALTGLVDHLSTTASTLAQEDQSLGASVAGIDDTLRQAPSTLTAVSGALGPVGQLSAVTVHPLRVAPPILRRATVTLNALLKVVSPAERSQVMSALRGTFDQFPTTLTDLEKVFPLTQSLSRCLSTHVIPILNSVVPDGALSSGRPVWQDFVHFLVGSASAAQNFDGNGYWERLLTGGGTNSVTFGSQSGVGTLVGDLPSSGTLQGVRPVWHGDLTTAAFQPQVGCSSDPLPSLQTSTGAPDATPVSSQANRAVTPFAGLTQQSLHGLLVQISDRVHRTPATGGGR